MQDDDADSPKSGPFNLQGGLSELKTVEIPKIELPQAGGAIRGIDEKLSVNGANGTASFSVPLPVAAARGVAPQLQLSYSSGSGNSIFGLGWAISLESIKRKTNRQLPQYNDLEDSDTYLFASAEDLVPEFAKGPGGDFLQNPGGGYQLRERDSADGQFQIRCYRPRVEGLYSRIERWLHKDTLEVRWRILTKDNITILLGWSDATRIADPNDVRKVFEWLPEFIFDDLGNCCHYVYKQEDSIGLDNNLPCNSNRRQGDQLQYSNCYLTDIYYGNRTPYSALEDIFPEPLDYMFHTAFDYGEYDLSPPYSKTASWAQRQDPFSNYKPGFELRTNRLCRRVLLFHQFQELPGGVALVRSLDFEHDDNGQQGFTFLRSITSRGYIKDANGDYSSKSLPPMVFNYQQHAWSRHVQVIDTDNITNAPVGLSSSYQLADLYSEGLSGILVERSGSWYYKRNLGKGHFEVAKAVAPQPAVQNTSGHWKLMDLDADGAKQLVNFRSSPQGYFEFGAIGDEPHFHSFQQLAKVDQRSPHAKLLDLTGDGRADILISEDHTFTWYESKGRDGYSGARRVAKLFDEESGPAIVFADSKESIFIADMSGDGLNDIVRIRASEVCYWPNLGYGRFGRKVAMNSPPLFDAPDSFNPAYLRLGDISGSGTTDIVYLSKQKASCWLNLSGNSLSSSPFEVDFFAEIHNLADVTLADLLGTGTQCLVWSSLLDKDSAAPLRYIDLMSSHKPHLMKGYSNNMGKEVNLTFTPSTQFYIEDEQAGRPWVTKLHFPVQCLSAVETLDRITGHRFVSHYRYAHGYFDHAEREFRGFGMVEQTDSEQFEHWVMGESSNVVEQPLHQAPVLTRQWFHTGAFIQESEILAQFEGSYWYAELKRQGFSAEHSEQRLPDATISVADGLPSSLLDQLNAIEHRQAARACKSMSLRSEVFALDAPASNPGSEELRLQLTPFAVEASNCHIELIQPKGQNPYAVFAVRSSESISYAYERDIQDPRIAHTINLDFDQYGNLLESVSVMYPRAQVDTDLPLATQAAQGRTSISYKVMDFTNAVETDDTRQLPLPSEERTYELRGIAASGDYFIPADFYGASLAAEVPYPQKHNDPPPGMPERRLIEHLRSTYYRDDLSGPLPLHQLESRALPFETYQLAYTPALLTEIFAGKVDNATLLAGSYVHSEGDSNWWIRSGHVNYLQQGEMASAAQNRFFMPVSYTNPVGAQTKVSYLAAFTFIESSEDALGNRTLVEQFDFRTLTPRRLRDPNNNLSESLSDELGFVKVRAVLGKGGEADDLIGHEAQTSESEAGHTSDFFAAANSNELVGLGQTLLGHASSRYVYDLEAFQTSGAPIAVATIIREQHFQQNDNSPIQINFQYHGGLGEVVMEKSQAEPGLAKRLTMGPDNSVVIEEVDTSPHLRWVGTGRVAVNNKGNPVKRYEPYFSTSHAYEDRRELVETGVTAIFYYDPLGREQRMQLPDGTFSKTEFSSWSHITYDPGDTVLESSWHHNRVNQLINEELSSEGKDPLKEAEAATASEIYHDTPSIKHLDPLGRPVLQVQHNRFNGGDEFMLAIGELDIEGNLLSVTDPRGNQVASYQYSLLGVDAYQHLSDSGQRWILEDVDGKPLRTWDERNHEFQYQYDLLGRPTESRVIGGDGVQPLDHLFERIFYGEAEPVPENNNLRGRVARYYDTGGLSLVQSYDFKGKPLNNHRQLFADYKGIPNWTDPNLIADLENEVFISTTERDALGRPTQSTAPDGSVELTFYNEAGLLQQKQFQPDGGLLQTIINNVDYNSKGQRVRLELGNGVVTEYQYDSKNFNLLRVSSTAGGNQVLQDLRFTYDATGNISHTLDDAVPVQFFNNQVTSGLSTYIYDAAYRLRTATGRENNAALVFAANDNWNDLSFRHALSNGDPAAIRNYSQLFDYDLAGNLLQVQHQASGNNWTRDYTYQAANNRMTSTSVAGDNYLYGYHPNHGYINSMPHLEELGWNFKEKLVLSIRQKVLNGTPETTYYQYAADGERIRKITELAAAPGQQAQQKEQRIYLGNYERYEKLSGQNNGLVRHSLSVTDDQGRIALIDRRNHIDDGTLPSLIRYQISNHLNSACLEVDENAQTISYEEYHPFGTTAYQATNNNIQAAAKRYRYVGMERDDETGLSYHSARFYIAWLGRWLSADPSGIEDALNVYQYSKNNPVSLTDTNGHESDEQKASRLFEEFLVDQGVNYRKEVPFRVKVNGNWVKGRADFFVETSTGWEPVEMKGKASSPWTTAQKKYLPALQSGAQWETTNTRKFKTKVSGSGGGKVFNVHTVAAGKYQFQKLFTSSVIRRPGGDASKGEKVTVTKDKDGNVLETSSKPHTSEGTRSTPTDTKTKTKTKTRVRAKAKGPRVRGRGPLGLLVGGAVAGGTLLTGGDAYAAAQSVNPAAETTDALVEGGDTGDVGKGIATDIFYWTPPGIVVGTAELVWDLNQMAMDASHFPVPEGFTEQMVEEGRNPFCAICHDSRGPGSEAYRQQQMLNSQLLQNTEPATNALTDAEQEAVLEFINNLEE
ncbi:SpvB/TcaC N-terminal domain-containing protein [Microbulbifer sp. SSSA002]|uniref:SpvB/TcaC N-terminal domain-containing protein n=1 Tax=Microbulbifer sp. SSSA002 TaxID=3243376 RepID=UPI0040390C7A